MIEIDGRSQYRCDHWKNFAARVQAHLAAKTLPNTVLHFATGDQTIPQDGRLHLFFDFNAGQVAGAIEDQEGHQRAQALVGRMYLRVWAIPNCPDEYELRESVAVNKLVDRLLSQVVEQDPAKLAVLIRAGEEKARVRSRAAYIIECAKRFEKTVVGTRKAIADGHAAIAKLQADLVKKIREIRGAERKLEQLEACRGGEDAKYGQEFDKLLQVPKVKRVEAKEGKVIVFTDILHCIDPRTGKRHEIGAFRIELDSTRGMPSWFNLTRQVDGYKRGMHAPHVFPEGHACLGNTAEVFPELIGNYEYAAAAMVAIQFVESVNTDDGAGQHVNKWPEAPAMEVVRA